MLNLINVRMAISNWGPLSNKLSPETHAAVSQQQQTLSCHCSSGGNTRWRNTEIGHWICPV